MAQVRGEPYLPVCMDLIQAFLETSPVADICRVKAAILERICKSTQPFLLPCPKPVHLFVGWLNLNQDTFRFVEKIDIFVLE